MQTQSLTPEECAAKIRAASKLAVLTGAGLSTAAGVPDFRGPKGLYVTRAYDPETVFEITHFDRDPAPFYKFSRDFLGMLETIQPTKTHAFLADWEKRGKDVTVVTQNIDGLHQRAGSKRVLPMHGDYETAHCRRCGQGCDKATLLDLMREAEIPLCRQCSGVIKPDVVFFGENVLHMPESIRAARESDLMLVLGSSLTVYPAAGLPLEAGGDVVVVNRGEVGMRPSKNVHLVDADLDAFFQSVASSLSAQP